MVMNASSRELKSRVHSALEAGPGRSAAELVKLLRELEPSLAQDPGPAGWLGAVADRLAQGADGVCPDPGRAAFPVGLQQGCPHWDLLTECWEQLLEASDPQAGRRGQVMTPPHLARHLVGLMGVKPGQRWLDPAAGLGSFLQAALESGADPHELHAMEVETTQAALATLLLPASATVIRGDALCPLDDLPAGWPGGFDRVVLNPPYRNAIEARDPAWNRQRDLLKDCFRSARGSFDLYVPFIERGLQLLRPGGRLGLLVPDKWLSCSYGSALRAILPAESRLLRLQYTSARGQFPRVDFEMVLLVLEKRDAGGGGFIAAGLQLERLDQNLKRISASRPPSMEALADPKGWGCLVAPAGRRRLGSQRGLTLADQHEVRASLSTAEYYRIELREGAAGEAGLKLLSSGAIDPFVQHWGRRPTRFRSQRWHRPLVEQASLSPRRREETGRPRVLLANLSRRIEALAVGPGEALGVVNVMQIFCEDQHSAHRLAAWLNSAPLNEWVCSWYNPLRLSGQLALNRELVLSLPAPPTGGAVARELAEIGQAAAAGRLPGPLESLQQRLDQLVEDLLPLDQSQ